jgi:hypothetical protein
LAFFPLGTGWASILYRGLTSRSQHLVNEVRIVKKFKQGKTLFLAGSLLFASAFIGVAAQASTSTANTPLANIHPQQTATATPSPSPT